MELGKIIDDAFHYTKEGVLCNVSRWLKLILALILISIPLNGYIMRIYRGAQPAPEVDNWGTLFVDGLKLIIVTLVYAIPIIVLWAITYYNLIIGVLYGDSLKGSGPMMAGWAPSFGLLIVLYLVEIIIAVIVPVASIRFARTNSFSEAFNISAIIGYIGKIGWINYLLALIVVSLIIGIPIVFIVFALILLGILTGSMTGLAATFIAGIIIILILAPLFSVFQARCMTQVYDSVAPEA